MRIAINSTSSHSVANPVAGHFVLTTDPKLAIAVPRLENGLHDGGRQTKQSLRSVLASPWLKSKSHVHRRSGARVNMFAGETEKARLAFGRLKAWGTAQKANVQRSLPKPKPSSAAARLVAVNNLKKTAKGDSKIPPEKRVYLSVEAEAATTTSKFPSGGFFYSKDWVIGRVLDAAAKSLQVENVNNQGTDEKDKLRVFHVEGGRLLEFSEKVGDALMSGNKIVLLRGVGPSVPDLIEV
jgi:hypothetical protein